MPRARRQSIAHDLPPELHPPPWPKSEEGQQISAALNAWALHSKRPLVILLDEIDALQDHALISVLRQLRAGYPRRPDSFPASLALIGLRDVRDYKVKAGGSVHLGTSSPFNIAVRSITLRHFTQNEAANLLQQHTAETGQPFAPEAEDQPAAGPDRRRGPSRRRGRRPSRRAAPGQAG